MILAAFQGHSGIIPVETEHCIFRFECESPEHVALVSFGETDRRDTVFNCVNKMVHLVSKMFCFQPKFGSDPFWQLQPPLLDPSQVKSIQVKSDRQVKSVTNYLFR